MQFEIHTVHLYKDDDCNFYLILTPLPLLLIAGPEQDLIVIEQVEVIKPLASPDSLPVIVLDVKPLKTSCVTAGATRWTED